MGFSTSTFWNRIQQSLFPKLERCLGALTPEHKRVVALLDAIRIEEQVKQPPSSLSGRPSHDWKIIARAFVVKAILNIDSTRALINRLKADEHLTRICGWEHTGKIPHESSFSRVFAILATSGVATLVHNHLVQMHLSDQIVMHTAIDGSAIEGREKAKQSSSPSSGPKRKPGRPKKGEEDPPQSVPFLNQCASLSLAQMEEALPKHCDWGAKKNSQGHLSVWRGYKLHLACAEGEIPLAMVLTSASVHDSQAAPLLIGRIGEQTTVLYSAMDAAYDAKVIHETCRKKGIVPLIDPNHRNGEKIPNDPATELRYKVRSTVERVFSRLKDDFGASKIQVKGHQKVLAHLTFGILALTADQLLKLVT